MAESKRVPKRTAAKRARQTSSTHPRRSRGRHVSSAGAEAPDTKPFIVCLGASAGGLEALTEFFDHMPADSGMGFVVVTHRSPEHSSLQPLLLQRHTAMPVREVADSMRLQPNTVYLAPPTGRLAFLHETFQVMEFARPDVRQLPIDYFLRTLAEDWQEKAICIILSGTGTDGTLGLKAIKAKGGLSLVQAPASAQFTGMPVSALATNLVDFVLAPGEMPEQVLAYARNIPLPAGWRGHDTIHPIIEMLPKIFVLLRDRTGHDFTSYKTSTISRRVERRMKVQHIDTPAAYLQYLQETPHELDLLFKEFLISVTQFFRDPEAFAVLERDIIPQMLANHPLDGPIRVWVPGCATGEEAYSLAILLQEARDRADIRCSVQVFATDLDDQAITVARLGQFPEGIAADISADRLARSFVKEDDSYRVRKDIRDMVIFATQNLLMDPPFSRLDIISCRNLFIYIETQLQKQLLPLFHYALKPNGILFLGTSETVGSFTDLFDSVDKKWKIFRRKDTPAGVTSISTFSPFKRRRSLDADPTTRFIPPSSNMGLAARIEQFLVATYVPASVVVTDRGEVVYVHGHTGIYLELAPGFRNQNILDMAREGLRQELMFALQQAAARDDAVIRQGVQIETNGDPVRTKLTVQKISEPESLRGLLLVMFEPSDALAASVSASPQAQEALQPRARRRLRTADLERELVYTQTHLQNTVEELETVNEELRATNEEVQSTNEELQSSNEELETSREEMQSLNEELQTVNSELQNKVEELSQANNDMQNLLNSTNVATIFLDANLHIQRFFTKQMTQVIKLIDSDVGRPLSDLANNLNYANLIQDATEVLQTLVFKEVEVHTTEGIWFLMRLMPYRTMEHVINGLVITFVDISKFKAAEGMARDLRCVNHIGQVLHECLLMLGPDLRVITANQRFYEAFHLSPERVEQRHLYDLDGGQWHTPELRHLFETLLVQDSVCTNFEIEHTFPMAGHKVLLLNASRLDREAHAPGPILLAIQDVTDHRGKAR